MDKLMILAALAFAVSACAHKVDDDEEQGGGDRVELELQDQTGDTA